MSGLSVVEPTLALRLVVPSLIAPIFVICMVDMCSCSPSSIVDVGDGGSDGVGEGGGDGGGDKPGSYSDDALGEGGWLSSDVISSDSGG